MGTSDFLLIPNGRAAVFRCPPFLRPCGAQMGCPENLSSAPRKSFCVPQTGLSKRFFVCRVRFHRCGCASSGCGCGWPACVMRRVPAPFGRARPCVDALIHKKKRRHSRFGMSPPCGPFGPLSVSVCLFAVGGTPPAVVASEGGEGTPTGVLFRCGLHVVGQVRKEVEARQPFDLVDRNHVVRAIADVIVLPDRFTFSTTLK